MPVAFSVILIIVTLINFYACLEGFLLLRALLRAKRGEGAGGKLFSLVYWPLSLLAAFSYFWFRYSSEGMRSLFRLASSYWGLLLFIPFFMLADALLLGAALRRRYSRRARGGGRRRPARSAAGRAAIVRAAAVALAFGTIGLGSLSARYAKVTSYSLDIEKPLPGEGLRMVLISDIHIGSMVHKKQLARLVSKINALDADAVLIAGDIVDRNLDAYKRENLNEELGAIKARFGVFASPGNHDGFGGNLAELKELLAAAGIKMLADEAVLVNGAFYAIGRNDAGRRSAGRKPLGELAKGLDASLPLIVMDHQPLNLGEAEAAGADLQVSGHTHRGQIAPVNLAVKRMYENSYGLLYRGKTAFVVSSGCGTWGPPVRIGTRSEIVCIDLK